MDEELTLTEIVLEYKLNDSTLRHALNEGRISGRQRGKIWFVARSEIRRWLDTQRDPSKKGRRVILDT
jgi:hypothetical protein